MAKRWETIRVFISSTFRDMHSERDHLVTVVFPELRERVEQLGLEFFDVDLRWGVPAKDLNGETANSWEYCRQWIDRVEPFFVCILGQRYGWVPEPHHFRDVDDRQRQERELRSITDLEVRHAVLDTRRKRRSYFYLRATPVPEPNAEYVDPPEYQGRLEELKTAVRQCGRPVRKYSPEWTGQGFVGLKEFGDFIIDDLWSGVLRDERYVSKAVWRQVLNTDPDTDPRYTDESQPVPRDLWEKIVALVKPPPQDPLDAERQQMEAFGASRLRWFHGRTHELQQLTDFIHSTAENAPRLAVVAAVPGQGKTALIAKLSQSIQESAVRSQKPPFLITHFVGATERSATAHALVQRLLDELDHSGIEWPADEVKEGEEPKRDFNSLCNRLRQHLGDYVGDRRIVILLDALNQLTDGHDLHWLPSRLGPSVRIVVSCVDVGGPRSIVAKSPATTDVTDHVPPEQQVLRALTSRQPAPLHVPLGPLTENDVRTIVIEYLKEYCKELDREHVDAMCRMDQAKNPLYLLVMLGELRTLGGNDVNRIVGERIATLPHDYPDTVALFQWVLQRLKVFGPEAVRWWCLYLAHGRVGMASQELADLLTRKFGDNAAPTALLIERGIRRYLLRRGGQLDFLNSQLRQAVLEEFGPQAEPANVHSDIATYFRDSADPADNGSWAGQHIRGWSELAFHMFHAGHTTELQQSLMTYLWIRGKLQWTDVFLLISDYGLLTFDGSGPLGLLQASLSLSTHALLQDTRSLPSQLTGRLLGFADGRLLSLLEEIRHYEDGPWIRPLTANLTDPSGPLLGTMHGHTEFVRDVAVTPDSLRAVSASADHTLRVWDLQSTECLRTLSGHSDQVEKVLTAPDGLHAVSSSYDGTLRVWNLETGDCEQVFEYPGVGSGWTITDNNIRVVSGQANHTLKVVDLPSGRCRQMLQKYGYSWSHVAVTCDGSLAVTQATQWSYPISEAIKVWDLRTGECIWTATGGDHSTDRLEIMGFTPDGKHVLFMRSNQLTIWNLHTGECLRSLGGHIGSISCLAIAPDGLCGVAVFDRRTLEHWVLETGKCIRVLGSHEGVTKVVITPDGRRAVSASWDKTLNVWDLRKGPNLRTVEGHSDCVNSVAITPNRRKAISASQDKSIKLWDLQTGKCLRTLEGHLDGIETVAITPDGRYAVSGSLDHTLRVWDLGSGACLRTLEGHLDGVHTVAITPNGRRVVSLSLDGTLRIWDLQTGRCLRTVEGFRCGVSCRAITPDGRRLAFASGDTLSVLSVRTGVCLRGNERHGREIKCIVITPNGRHAVSASEGGPLKIWDLRTGRCVQTCVGAAISLSSVDVTPDGRLAVWASFGGAIYRVWDLRTGKCVTELYGHSRYAATYAIAPNGREMIVEDRDFTLSLWDLWNGECLQHMKGHADDINSVAVAPDGRHAVSTSADRTAKIWSLETGTCVAIFESDSCLSRCEWVADGKVLFSFDLQGRVHVLRWEVGKQAPSSRR